MGGEPRKLRQGPDVSSDPSPAQKQADNDRLEGLALTAHLGDGPRWLGGGVVAAGLRCRHDRDWRRDRGKEENDNAWVVRVGTTSMVRESRESTSSKCEYAIVRVGEGGESDGAVPLCKLCPLWLSLARTSQEAPHLLS